MRIGKLLAVCAISASFVVGMHVQDKGLVDAVYDNHLKLVMIQRDSILNWFDFHSPKVTIGKVRATLDVREMDETKVSVKDVWHMYYLKRKTNGLRTFCASLSKDAKHKDEDDFSSYAGQLRDLLRRFPSDKELDKMRVSYRRNWESGYGINRKQ